MSTIVTRSGKGSPLTNAEVDSNFTNLNTDKAELSGATFTGEITANGGIALGDNDKATFGASDDLEIYSDGTNGILKNTNGNYILLDTDNFAIRSQAGSNRIIVNAAGIDVTGTATMDGLTTDDDVSGTSTLGRYSSGFAYSLVRPSSSATGIEIRTHAGNALAHFLNDGTTKLHHNNAVKLSTTATGTTTVGTANATNMQVSNGGKYIFGGENTRITGETDGSGKIRLFTGGTEKVILDGANVGIGTSSIDNKVNIQESALSGRAASNSNTSLTLEHATDTGIQFFSATQTQLRFGDAASTAAGSIIYEHDTDKLRLNTGSLLTVATGGSERIKIDSAGNLLVGKTSADNTTGGTTIYGGIAPGAASFVRSAGNTLVLNRLTSDGEIIAFRKDGTTVGSIGTQSGRLTIGDGDTGLRFADDFNNIQPFNITTNVLRDNAIDLGSSAGRFKDLYLSSGVYLGGTGAANKLDNYESGTWSPIFADASTGGNVASVGAILGSYTKVGNLVTVGCGLNDINISGLTSSNAIYIRGLPFVTGTTQIRSGCAFLDRVTFSGYVTAYATGSHVLLFNTATGAHDAALLVSSIDTSGSDVFFTLQYQV